MVKDWKISVLEMRQECPLSALLVNITLEFLPRENRQEKKWIKGIQIGIKEVKLSFSIDYMISCKEKSQRFHKKLLELVYKFNKVAGDEINLQKIDCVSVHQQWTTWNGN